MADSLDGVAVEPEINAGRRAFAVTQSLFAGSAIGVPQSLDCGWHDTSVHPEAGAFALVRAGANLDDLIGEIVEVSNGDAQVLVYVLQAASIPTDFSLYRRAWIAIALPSVESLDCDVVVID